jgi:oxepin-CoA hydrolase/3-oxo-5,6-dehydrosuberyl-CoA semialdehyde dehydrogenase
VITLKSHVCGGWVTGDRPGAVLVDPSTEEVVAQAPGGGVDFGRALDHARVVGGAALRGMTFAQRGELLKTLAKAIHACREELLDVAQRNGGNTRSDAKFDVDGASATLGAYAELGQSLGEGRFLVDGAPAVLGRSSRLAGQHVRVPRRGVAVHINAFNFPAWGVAEKAAVALLSGMPVVSRPATATALLAHRMMECFVASGALPEGALSFVVGPSGDLLDRLGSQDVLAFTGSGATGALFRAKANIIARSVPVNVEADSLNAAVLGLDVAPGSDTWDLFLADVTRDITQKTGQKCTAIRRVFVPSERLDEVREALCERLARHRPGNPTHEGVTVGPVATLAQLQDVRSGIDRLVRDGAQVAAGGSHPVQGLGAPEGKGYFVAPTLLVAPTMDAVPTVHQHEVFGPVATLLPYEKTEDAIALVARAEGCLVSTVYTDDRSIALEAVLGLAAWHGRVCVGGAKVAGAWLGPGTVLPQLLHGGPGRAGGGAELGGLRGMELYLQRTALQGYGPLLEHLVQGGARVG